jgi:TolB-like protein/class 3 adenylate cyclase/Tfp pilus assembly protein PilF
MEPDFLRKLKKTVQENISDEMFGVSELAESLNMSRSSLLRKTRKLTDTSASQFIRKVRLEQAMKLLKDKSMNVSDVSFKVGFGSTSYFIKVFRDEYGYSPGEVGKKVAADAGRSGSGGQKHQLAAIMFTDIEGYTALMQHDEEKAIATRRRHREIFKRTTEKHHGKILQYYGDGTLSTFHSAIDAVRCGIVMQQAFAEEPTIPMRIGIHTGDILFSEDGIIGDGVNVAARIESLAIAHSVCISEKVFDEIKNQAGIETQSIGVFELKNVDKPMEVYAVTNPGLKIPYGEGISEKAHRTKAPIVQSHFRDNKPTAFLWVLVPLLAVAIGYFLRTSNVLKGPSQYTSLSNTLSQKKSIAVLPFRNESNDSSNVYFINGLMEATLNSLQKIHDLRVISRTSAEKYRHSEKTSPEIARELNVQYLIEGSGQKIGEQILLHIQLIDAGNDRHLWGEQYNRQVDDVFSLQKEISTNIIKQIEVIITPEEQSRIEKAPTESIVAYDYFLQGLELLKLNQAQQAIAWFQKATDEDQQFARAYAAMAIAYYQLDQNQAEKIYGEQINSYADKAMLYDEKLPQSLIAKALYYMHEAQYELAISFFEKALEYEPNYDLAYVYLVDLYVNHLPNTAKYLEYALKGMGIDAASYDSLTASFSYLHISNAFIQSGFTEESGQFIDISLKYAPDNLYSAYVKAYIQYATHQNPAQTKEQLLHVLSIDPNRLDVLQEVGKICYFMHDYKNAYTYYKQYLDLKAAAQLEIYRAEDAKIGFVMSKVGKEKESEELFSKFKVFAETNPSIYQHMHLAMYYSYMEDTEESIRNLKAFSEQDNYHYWTILFSDLDPLLDNVRKHPEYPAIMRRIEEKFWNGHKKIRASLEGEGLI